MKKLLLMLLFGVASYAQNFGQPEDLFGCEANSDGFALFDLSTNNNIILNGLSPNDYSITYHEIESDAITGSSPLPNLYTNSTADFQEIYVRITDNSNGEIIDFLSFNLIVQPSPEFNLDGGSICIDGITGEVSPSYLYVVNANFDMDMASYIWTLNGMPIPGAGPVIEVTEAGEYSVTVNVNACITTETTIVTASGPAAPIGTGYTVNGQDITVTVEGAGNYQYQLDNGEAQESNIFTNLSLGMHTVYVHDLNGCGTLEIALSIPPAPTGEPIQGADEGETLADLEVEGDNIQWYETEFGDTPLSMATLLVDGTTYYATQSIDGVESAQRLAVTVNFTLGLENTIFKTLRCYPNPTVGIITIDNTNGIDIVSIANTLGQQIFTKAINSNNGQLDVSSLSKGVYFVTVTSGNAAKTLKVIKE